MISRRSFFASLAATSAVVPVAASAVPVPARLPKPIGNYLFPGASAYQFESSPNTFSRLSYVARLVVRYGDRVYASFAEYSLLAVERFGRHACDSAAEHHLVSVLSGPDRERYRVQWCEEIIGFRSDESSGFPRWSA